MLVVVLSRQLNVLATSRAVKSIKKVLFKTYKIPQLILFNGMNIKAHIILTNQLV